MENTARDQAAVDAVRTILELGDWFKPLTIKAELQALRQLLAQTPRPDLTAEITKLLGDLSRFNRALSNPLDDSLFTDLNSIKPEHLTVLENNLTAIIAPPPEAKVSMDAVVPANLQELLEAQAKVTAEKKLALGRPSQLTQQIKQAQEIAIRAQLLRVAVSRRLYLTLLESSYIKDLQVIYSKEAINQLLSTRIDLAVNQAVTALAINQLGLSDPANAAAYFTAQLEITLKADPNLAVALTKTPKADRKNALTDAKNLAEETAKEVQPAAQAFRAEQDSSLIYRVNAENIAQGEVEAVLAKSGRSLTKKQAGRLAESLAKYSNQPDKQLRILKQIIPEVTPEIRQELMTRLKPAISTLAKSSDHPSFSETINESSLVNLARTNPALFPFRLTAAIRGNRLSTGKATALIVRLSQQLGISPDYVAMRLAGITAKNLGAHLNNLAKGQPVFGLPTQPPLKPDNPVFKRLNNALPEIGRLDESREEFQFNQIASSLKFPNAVHSITRFFDVGKAIRFNLGRLPPINRIVSSAQTVFSGLRVRSGAVNSMFNFFSWAGRGIRAAPSVLTAPFRAVGSLVSTGWNNVKIWAGTQVKAGLAKAGAWLAKKGVTAAATKLGLMAVGKGAAALLAQAVPVAGQIAGALTVLSVLGDVGKFIWDNRKGIGVGLGGMFFLGQMLLAKVLGVLGTAAWSLGLGGIGGVLGFMAGGPVGAVIGAGLGGTLGYLIGSGALGSALAGLGSALGSAAAGLSSFIGALTAPSLVASLPATLALIVPATIVGVGLYQTLFFNNFLFGALYVQPGPGGVLPIDIVGSCPIPNGYNLCGSLGSPYQDGCIGGHGSNEYWDNQGEPACRYGLPVSDPQCTYNDIPGNVCNKGNASCQVYGFASDFTYRNGSERCNNQVFLPSINGIKLIWEVSWGGTGGDGMLRATDGTNVYEMYLTHLNSAPLGGESGNSTGTLTCTIPTPHVHVEIKINGEYVRPDFLCEQRTLSTSAYILRGSLNETNIVISNTPEIRSGSQTCQWTQNKGLFGGINANYYKADSSPIGWAGYGVGDVKDYGCGASCPTLTFQIDTNGQASIVPYSNSPSPNPNLLMAVSGTGLSSTSGRFSRTALGIAGNELVLVVMPNGSNSELQQLMNNLGVSSALQLDGGGSSTFCSGDQTIWPISGGPRSIPVSIGLKSGIFIKQ